jgi:hypothetical protein
LKDYKETQGQVATEEDYLAKEEQLSVMHRELMSRSIEKLTD